MAFQRSAVLFFVGITVGLAALVCSSAGLAWDGSLYFYYVLQHQGPLVIFERYSAGALQLPLLFMQTLTDNPTALRFAFEVPLAMVPLGVLVGCWMMLRRTAPHLFVWPALGVGLALLPGLFFQVSETLMAYEVGWILVVVLVLRVPHHLVPVAICTVLALFYLSAVSAYLFVLLAILAGILAVQDQGRRRSFALLVLLLAAAGLRRFGYPQDFAAHPFRAGDYKAQFFRAFWGLPLAGPIIDWLSGLFLLLRRKLPRLSRYGPGAAMMVALLALTAWAVNPRAWAFGLDFRDLAVGLEIPLAAMMVIDRGPATNADGSKPEAFRSGHALTLACIGLVFPVVLIAQSVSWAGLETKLSSQVQAAPGTCVPTASVGDRGTALDHWATPTLVIDLQGRTPTKLLLDPADCQEFMARGVLRINFFATDPARGGWFHFPT